MEGTNVFIISEPPYGSEKPWNALRLAKALVAIQENVKIFLLGDAVVIAKKGQKPPTGHYNLGQMVMEIIKSGAEIRVCLTCIESRGLCGEELIE